MENSMGKLRNLSLVSHSGAGKTTLAESLLFVSNGSTRMGRIEDGNTVSDYEPEEIKRQSSNQIALIPCFWDNHKINIIDPPGYADFSAEVNSSLRVSDSAIVVVSAPAGVEVGTEQMWHNLEEQSLPRIVVVNKMDRESANFLSALSQIQEYFGRHCVPTHLPIGQESSFSGVVDILEGTQELPELSKAISDARERLIEAIAETDDEIATKFLEGETITEEELRNSLRHGVKSGTLIPVIPAAATNGLGSKEILNAIIDLLPSPHDLTESNSQSNDKLAAVVFKTTADPYVGKISLFRVYSGTFSSDSQVWNANKQQSERVGQLFISKGKNQEQTPVVHTGDIGAVTKLSVTATGDTLCTRENNLALESISFPKPRHTVAVYPRSKQDVDKMSIGLTRITEEDPSLSIRRDQDTGEVLLSGLGDTHVEVAAEKIKRKFGTDLVLQLPKVPYRETITASTRVEYKHKKQTGGHGQYGHVFLELEPTPHSEGFQFDTKIVGGSVPREYFPAVEKGVVKSLEEGSIAGYPVVNLRVVLYDGSFHPVDSSGMSFEIAGGYAMRKGLSLAQPSLLEPIMKAQINVPDSFTGEVTGGLNTKRARILGMTPQGGYTLIESEVPQAEMLRYSAELRSLTQGRGSFSLEFDHYEVVPLHLTSKITEEVKKAGE